MPNSITRSIKKLLGPSRNGTNPHVNYLDEYFARYAYPKKLCDGVDWIAKIE